MNLTPDEAADEIFGMIQDGWSATLPFAVDGVLPEIRWQGIEYNSPPSQKAPYTRAHTVHTGGRRASLGGPIGSLYENIGFVLVECFGPCSSGKGLTTARGLANIAKGIFQGRSSLNGIIFKNARINEIGSADGWYQVNALIDFSYDEVK